MTVSTLKLGYGRDTEGRTDAISIMLEIREEVDVATGLKWMDYGRYRYGKPYSKFSDVLLEEERGRRALGEDPR